MFKKTKGVIIGIILGVMLGSGVAVAAGHTTTLYNVLNSGIRIVINGTELHPTDVNGKKVEPMIYNGTTYLPVRAVADALGQAVYWDGPNYTVYLGDMNGKLKYPTVMMTDLKSINESPHKTNNLTDNYGNKYGSAVDNYYYQSYEYLLAMKYSRFKGTLYIPEGTTHTGSVYLTIKADGHLLYTSPDMSRSSAPVNIDVNVTGYNDISIEWSGSEWSSGSCYCCLADAGFYQ